MQLYYHPNSTYSRRVRIAAIEKGIDLELVPVAMEKLAHRRREYLSINPMGRVPTLVDGDFKLYESSAILEYLEERFPDTALLPADREARALARMFMQLSNVDFGAPGSTIYFPRRFLPEARWNREEMARAQKQIQRHLSALEERLQNRAYLCDAYSLADICYAPFLHFRELLEVPFPPAVEAWAIRLLQRPAMMATIPPA